MDLAENSPRTGILIAIEGIDGAGKTTQARLLAEALIRSGESVVPSKEPTNGQWGRIIRNSATEGRMSLEDELEMFIKDRREHVDTLIGPALKAGSTVILDRYFYSTIAYQGARGADIEKVSSEMYRLFPKPDAVFILDVDPVLGIHRIANQRGEEPNHFEDRANLAAARTIFKSIEHENAYHLDGSVSIEAVRSEILKIFVNGPLKAARCAKHYGCDDPTHCSFRLTNSCEWWLLSRRIYLGNTPEESLVNSR